MDEMTQDRPVTAVATRPDWLDQEQISELKDALQLDSYQKGAFRVGYANNGHVAASMRALGLTRQSHYQWLEHDDRYSAAFRLAHRWYVDNMEGELRHRATVGDERGVYYKGDKIATYRQKSDLCLIFALKGELPEKYRDNVHITGEVTTIKEYSVSLDDL